MENFLQLISNVDLSGKEFTLNIDGVNHHFNWIPGGVSSGGYQLCPYFLNESDWERIEKYNH